MTNQNDIVTQLREEGFITHIGGLPRESKILHAAADEIERLRKEVEKENVYLNCMADEIERLKESSFDDNEIVAFINKHWDGSTDNSGQIIVYTGMMEDDHGNIVEWKDRFDEKASK